MDSNFFTFLRLPSLAASYSSLSLEALILWLIWRVLSNKLLKWWWRWRPIADVNCHHCWRQLSYYSYIISRMTYKQCYVELNLILKWTYDKDTVNNLTHIRFIIPLTSFVWEEGFWKEHIQQNDEIFDVFADEVMRQSLSSTSSSAVYLPSYFHRRRRKV